MPATSGTLTPASAEDVGALTAVVTRLRRALRTSVRSEVAWERLPMSQVEILQRLAEEPGLRISELAVKHHLAVNTVSNLIQQMVVTQLVERIPDRHDRRAVGVVMTRQGADVLASWSQANNRRLAQALSGLADGDRRTLAQAIPSLVRLVERLEINAAP